MDEVTYLDEKSVLITNTRAVFNGKTYAISNISKVSMARAHLPLLAVLIQVVLFIAVLMMGGIGLATGIVWMIIMGVFCLGLFIFNIVDPRNKIFTVMIGTSGSMFDEEAFRSTDQGFIQKIVDTLNTAIVKRG